MNRIYNQKDCIRLYLVEQKSLEVWYHHRLEGGERAADLLKVSLITYNGDYFRVYNFQQEAGISV